MKYIKERKLEGQKYGGEITDEEAGTTLKGPKATIGQMFLETLKFYESQHLYFVQQRPPQILSTPSEILGFNRTKEILEGKPQEEGYWRFEDPDFNVLKKVIDWTVPISPWWRDGELYHNILEEATERIPKTKADKVAPTEDAPKANVAKGDGPSKTEVKAKS